jgi:hypothetical protein
VTRIHEKFANLITRSNFLGLGDGVLPILNKKSPISIEDSLL